MSAPPTRIVRVRPRSSDVGEADAAVSTKVRARLRTESASDVAVSPGTQGSWRPRRVLVLAVAVLASLLVLQGGIALSRGEAALPSASGITSVASDAVQSILQMSGGGSLNTAVFTEELGGSLAGGSESFLADLEGSGYRVSGGPIASGVVEQDDDRAVVLVATTGDIRDATGQAVSTHTLTFELELVLEGDTWLVSSMAVVS